MTKELSFIIPVQSLNSIFDAGSTFGQISIENAVNHINKHGSIASIAPLSSDGCGEDDYITITSIEKKPVEDFETTVVSFEVIDVFDRKHTLSVPGDFSLYSKISNKFVNVKDLKTRHSAVDTGRHIIRTTHTELHENCKIDYVYQITISVEDEYADIDEVCFYVDGILMKIPVVNA